MVPLLACGHGHPPRRLQQSDVELVTIKHLPPASGISGRVIGSNGKAVQLFGAVIVGNYMAPNLHDVETFRSTDGSFFLNAKRGSYDLIIVGESFARTVVPGIVVGDNVVTKVGEVRVKKGRSVEGQLIDEQGLPVSRARVSVGPLKLRIGTENIAELSLRVLGVHTAYSDSKGYFRFDHLAELGIEKNEMYVVSDVNHDVSTGFVRVPSSGNLTIIAKRTGELRVTLVGDDDPCTHRRVVKATSLAQLDMQIAEIGCGTVLIPLVPAGEYTVVVDDDNSRAKRVVVEPSQTSAVSLQIR